MPIARIAAAALAAAALAVGAVSPPRAHADVFGQISLASEGALPGSAFDQQADYAHDAAISADGRYVVFDGSYGGRTGVWRRDLQSGVVEAVAAADANDAAISAPDATLPSISEDGRYVSFTTTAALDPSDDTNRAPDVYVRDMDLAPGQACEPGPGTAQPCAYTLVSAVDGANTGLTYEPTGASPISEETEDGAVAAGRSAISDDGREVAFVTTAISNLAGAGTPGMQVAVRYLDSDHTELVSVADEPSSGAPIAGEAVSGTRGPNVFGAVFSGTLGEPPFNDPQPYGAPAVVGASISGDGSTVAWMGVDVAEQTRVLPGESLSAEYAEPLWRRIGDGPSAPIRRVSGGSDPNLQCLLSGESALPLQPSPSDPCQGPFFGDQAARSAGLINNGEFVDPVPKLTRDGYTVAFIANAPLVSLGQGFGLSELHSDLYLANMHEGFTRVQALTPLTELASGNQQDVAEDSPIEDAAISPDGSHVAFTTKRTVFPLGSPAYVSAPQAAPGMLELFSIDLADDTMARVTKGFEGGPSEHPHTASVASEDPYTQVGDGALSPSFSADGNTIAFSSTASNLVFGDGNTPPLGSAQFDGSDAFVVSREVFDPLPTPQSISPQPPGPAIAATWRLGVTARAQRNGTVLLYVTVPGAGTLAADAKSAIRVRAKRHGRAGTSVATRSVATSKRVSRTGAGELTTLTLTLASRYRSLAAKRPGLASTIALTFTASHKPTLRASVRASFLRTLKAKKKASTKKAGKTTKHAAKSSDAAAEREGSR
jgi:WD40-like Beta Propeller Repeat